MNTILQAALRAVLIISMGLVMSSVTKAQTGWQRADFAGGQPLNFNTVSTVNASAQAIVNPRHLAASQSSASPGSGMMMLMAAAAGADSQPAEIETLATALNHDPRLILDWMYRTIRFTPYHGLKRGAYLTLIERAGNSFDIAALMVALLKASGYSDAKYLFGNLYVPLSSTDGNDILGWLGVTAEQAGMYIINSGGDYVADRPSQVTDSDLAVDYFVHPEIGSCIQVPHVWVRVTINNQLYDIDPSYKISDYYEGVHFPSILNMGYSSWEDLWNPAQGTFRLLNNNGTDVPGTGYKGTAAGRANVRAALANYTTKLVEHIVTSDTLHDRSGLEIIGGRAINQNAHYNPVDPDYEDPCRRTIFFVWDAIPDDYHVKLRFSVGNLKVNNATPEYTFDQLAGRKISITFGNSLAKLYLDDVQVGAEPAGSSTSTPAAVTLEVHYPDIAKTSPEVPPFIYTAAPLQRSGSYVILYGFDQVLGRLRQRTQIQARHVEEGKTETSRELVTENLYLMGLQYLNEASAINEIAAGTTFCRYDLLHLVGIAGCNQAPFVDLPGALTNAWPIYAVNYNNALSLADLAFMSCTYWMSMLEHSIIEQALVADANPANQYLDSAVSTMKLINKSVDKNMEVFYAGNPAAWSAVASQLQNYAGTQVFTDSASIINSGGCVLLPANYNQTYNNYTGMGYITMRITNNRLHGMTMGITGALGTLNGGASSVGSPFGLNLTFDQQIKYGLVPAFDFSTPAITVPKITLGDPVDASSGAFYLSATDLALGDGNAPEGLALTRYYNSRMCMSDATGLGKGWTHNYDVRLAFRHPTDFDLTRATAAEVAPIMVGTRTIFDMLIANNNGDAKSLVMGAYIACWMGDQLINTRASVQMGERTLEFVKLPDGTYAPPAGVAATLTGTPASGHSLKFRKGKEIVFRGMDGRFISMIDRNNSGQNARTLAATYTASASYSPANTRIQSVSDATGRTLTFNYTGNALDSVSDGTGRSASYGRGATAFTYADPEGKTTTYNWDSLHRITSIVDARDRTTVVSDYDDQDRVVTQWSLGLTSGVDERRWTYHYGPGVTRYEDPLGNANLYHFDARGRQTIHYNELGHRTQRLYDGIDRRVSATTPKNEWTYFGYDKNHEMTFAATPNPDYEENNPAKPQWLIQLTEPSSDDSTSLPRIETSPGGLETTTNYYGFHLPSSIVKTGGYAETFEYDGRGRVISHHPVAYAPNQFITYSYDDTPGYTRKVTVTYPDGTPDGVKEATWFDNRGNAVQHISRAGEKITTEYNVRRQPVKTVRWPGVFDAQSAGLATTGYNAATAQVTEIAYDDAGDIASVKDPRGNITHTEHDPEGRVLSVRTPDDALSTKIYDKRNLLAAATNPLGFAVTFGYDEAQRLTSTTTALKTVSTTTYDDNGHPVGTSTPLEHIATTEYDSLGRQAVGTDALGRDIAYGYDLDGRMTSLTNRRGHTHAFSFNDASRVTSSITFGGKTTSTERNTRGLVWKVNQASGNYIENTAFDNEGRVLARLVKNSSGQTLSSITMSHDAAGRLLSVSENGETSSFTYDDFGRLATYTDCNGNIIAYGYDLANNLTAVTYPGAGNKTVTYSYDSCNRLSTVTDWANRQTSYAYDLAGRLIKTTRPNGTVRKHVYDAAGQLRFVEERGPAPASPLLWMRSLEYDADGRITKTHTWPAQIPVTTPAANADDTATYDADNRLATWTDANGASISCAFDDDGNMLSGPSSSTTSTLNYTYDAHNRLTGVGAQTNLYRYSPDGHRVEADGVAYVIDPNASLSRALMRINGGTTTYYIWGANGLEYEITGETTKTYHPDHLGSTMLLTNASGAPTGEYFEYDSYGTPTHVAGNPTTPFRWHGTLGVTTEANGLVHMRARFYHPRLMRFINQDPIGFEGGMNWYAAFNNNPVLYVDPSGLEIEIWAKYNPAFESAVKAAIADFKSTKYPEEVRDAIKQLEDSTHVHVIRPPAGRYTSNSNKPNSNFLGWFSKGTGSITTWNMRDKTGYANQERDPVVGLLHELGHAFDRDSNNYNALVKKGHDPVTFHPYKEDTSVKFENYARSLYNLPARPSYYTPEQQIQIKTDIDAGKPHPYLSNEFEAPAFNTNTGWGRK